VVGADQLVVTVEPTADVDRLSGATPPNWDELKTRVSVALDSLDLQVKALRPDAEPMGGAGPS
jgi:hypothetical protein